MKIYRFCQQIDFEFLKDVPTKDSHSIKKEFSGDWKEDLENLTELGLTTIDVLEQYNLDYNIIEVNDNKLLTLTIDKNLLVSDDFEEDYPSFEEAQEWIDSLLDYRLDEYVPEEENNFWENPEILYHGTYIDRWENIKDSGILEPRNLSRAISNRHMGSAIFTSTNRDFVESSYGEVILEINTIKMKMDGYMPLVSRELPLEESERRMRLANLIGYDEYLINEYTSDGLSIETVVIYGNVPLKYIKKIN